MRSLTLGGLGVGVIPRRVASYNMGGRLRRLHDSLPNIPDRIFLAYRADMHRTKGAMLLKDALVTHGKELAGEEASLALRPVEDEPRP